MLEPHALIEKNFNKETERKKVVYLTIPKIMSAFRFNRRITTTSIWKFLREPL